LRRALFFRPAPLIKGERIIQMAVKLWLARRAAVISIFTLLFVAAAPTKLQAQTLNFTVYTSRNGLPQNQVFTVFQDSRGYIWVGTYSGASRYNGYSFETLNIGSGLRSNEINIIGEDELGRMYFGTEGGGLSIYHNGRFEHFHVGRGLLNDDVNDVLVENSTRLWAATEEGLTLLERGKSRHYTTEDGLPDDYCRVVYKDRSGRVWVGTNNGAAYLSGDRFVSVGLDGLIEDPRTRMIVQDGKGAIWFGAGRLCRLVSDRIEVLGAEEGLPETLFFSAAVDTEGVLWMGTMAGAFYYADGRFTQVTRRHGLAGDTVYCIFQDREKNLWFGTDWGLHKLVSGPFEVFNEQTGLSHGIITAVYEDSQGRLWIGTGGGGIDVMDGGRIWSLGTAQGLPNPHISSVTEAPDGTMIIGTIDGLCLWDGRSARVIKERDGLPSSYVVKLFRDSRDRIWVGTSRGLRLLDGNRVIDRDMRGAVSDRFISAFAEDKKRGHVWIGTGGAGCARFDGRTWRFFGEKDGFTEQSVWSMDADAEGNVWIGTNGKGVYRFDGESFKNYTTADGPANDTVWQVLADSEGYIWFGTNKGLDRFDGKSFRHFDASDGLAGEEFCGEACWEDAQGRLWFGCVGGLNLYQPDREFFNEVAPRAYVEHILANDREVKQNGWIYFRSDQNTLTFEYVGLSYRDEAEVLYSYYLEGMDSKWSNTTREHTIRYAGLPPGMYSFKVRACNGDGVWSDSAAVVHFVIDPPIFLSWWFITLSISSIALLGVLAHRLRLELIRREKRVLEERVRERTRELTTTNAELKAFSYSVSHDLRNPLWRMRGYLQLLKSECVKRLESSDLEMMEKADRAGQEMQDIISALLKLSRLSKEELVIGPSDLSGVAREIVEYLKRIQPGRNARVEIQEGVTATGDLGLLRQLLENLISNAWKFSAGRNPAIIQFGAQQQGKETVYYVRDNGVGFDMSDYEKLFLPFRRLHPREQYEGTGIGLATVRRIVERHKGRIWAEGVVGGGATFYFTLP
jgi:ligand-binding sensor domain-containing protein/signal transduction histidine kinase